MLKKSESAIVYDNKTGKGDFHTVVEDKISALPRYIRQGYTIAIEPFETSKGRCAIVQDLSGKRLCILDRTSRPHLQLLITPEK